MELLSKQIQRMKILRYSKKVFKTSAFCFAHCSIHPSHHFSEPAVEYTEAQPLQVQERDNPNQQKCYSHLNWNNWFEISDGQLMFVVILLFASSSASSFIPFFPIFVFVILWPLEIYTQFSLLREVCFYPILFRRTCEFW